MDEIRVFPPKQCWRRNTCEYCFPTCLGEKREGRHLWMSYGEIKIDQRKGVDIMAHQMNGVDYELSASVGVQSFLLQIMSEMDTNCLKR